MRDYRDFDEQFRETPAERNERLRESRHKRTIETLQALIYDMSGMLADEFDYLSDEGITDLGGFVEAAKRRYWDREPKVRTLA